MSRFLKKKKPHLTTTIRNETYQLKTTWYYNARVKNKRFKFEDLVLRKLKTTGHKES